MRYKTLNEAKQDALRLAEISEDAWIVAQTGQRDFRPWRVQTISNCPPAFEYKEVYRTPVAKPAKILCCWHGHTPVYVIKRG